MADRDSPTREESELAALRAWPLFAVADAAGGEWPAKVREVTAALKWRLIGPIRESAIRELGRLVCPVLPEGSDREAAFEAAKQAAKKLVRLWHLHKVKKGGFSLRGLGREYGLAYTEIGLFGKHPEWWVEGRRFWLDHMIDNADYNPVYRTALDWILTWNIYRSLEIPPRLRAWYWRERAPDFDFKELPSSFDMWGLPPKGPEKKPKAGEDYERSFVDDYRRRAIALIVEVICQRKDLKKAGFRPTINEASEPQHSIVDAVSVAFEEEAPRYDVGSGKWFNDGEKVHGRKTRAIRESWKKYRKGGDKQEPSMDVALIAVACRHWKGLWLVPTDYYPWARDVKRPG